MKPVLSFILVPLLAAVIPSCCQKKSPQTPPVAAEAPLVEITNDAVLLSLADPHQPLRAGASGLWCVTLPAAWQQGTKLTGKPMVLSTAEQLSGWLNAVPPAADLVPEKSLYASFGELADADTARVAREAKELFGTAGDLEPKPTPEPDDYFLYARLEAAAKFPVPYLRDDGLTFTSGGKGTAVQAFRNIAGHGEKSPPGMPKPALLYFPVPQAGERYKPVEQADFAVRLTGPEAAFEIIAATMPRPENLDTAWAAVVAGEQKFAREKEALVAGKTESNSEYTLELLRQFDAAPKFRMPCLAFRRDSEFPELIGQIDGNRLTIDSARQQVSLRLNEQGASIKAEALLKLKAVPEAAPLPILSFNRPFLLALRKPGAAYPFFLLWVEDARVLTPLT